MVDYKKKYNKAVKVIDKISELLSAGIDADEFCLEANRVLKQFKK